MTGAAPVSACQAAGGCIDVERMSSSPVTASTGTLGGDHVVRLPRKAFEHDVAASGTVEERIGDIGDRLYGGCSATKLPSAPVRAKELTPG